MRRTSSLTLPALRRRLVLGVAGLLWMFGCDGNGGGSPTPPPDPSPDPSPDISGVWSGTETVVTRGGLECNPDVQDGTRTGDMFNVSQVGAQIVILQLANCLICRFTGTILANGTFRASGTTPPVTIHVEGQVSGNSMTATKFTTGVDCDRLTTYDLTRD
jgi:hypothetical protein